jgi:hypothetical protein
MCQLTNVPSGFFKIFKKKCAFRRFSAIFADFWEILKNPVTFSALQRL